MKMFMLFLIVHKQCIRKFGASQGGGYDYYPLLGCDLKLSGIYRHFWKHIFHIFKVKSVTTHRTENSVSGNLNTPTATVDMPTACHAIRLRKKRVNASFEFSENVNGIKRGFSPPGLHRDAG
jgi:hypothetical protein